jgi:hypothetical protein
MELLREMVVLVLHHLLLVLQLLTLVAVVGAEPLDNLLEQVVMVEVVQEVLLLVVKQMAQQAL